MLLDVYRRSGLLLSQTNAHLEDQILNILFCNYVNTDKMLTLHIDVGYEHNAHTITITNLLFFWYVILKIFAKKQLEPPRKRYIYNPFSLHSPTANNLCERCCTL